MTDPIRAGGNRSSPREAARTSNSKEATSASAREAAGKASPPRTTTSDGFDASSAKLDLGLTPSAEVAAQARLLAITLASPAGFMPLDSPTDALAFVKNGQLSLTFPLAEGTKLHELLETHPNTVIYLDAKVTDGRIDPKKTKIRIEPPLDGPLWTQVNGLDIGSDGTVSVNVRGFPDLTIGEPFPLKMKDLAAMLNKTRSGATHGIDVMGYAIGSTQLGMGKSESKLHDRIPGDNVKVQIRDVELTDEPVSLAGGSIRLGAGSKLAIEGNLNDLRATGQVSIKDLWLQNDGVELKGSSGKANLSLRYRSAGGKLHVTSEITDLSLKTEYAVSKRANGDFIALAQGQLKDGALRLDVAQAADGTLKTDLTKLDLEGFEGQLTGAQLTVPDGSGTARVTVGASRVSGNLSVDADRVLFRGEVDLKASIEDYQSGTGMDLKRLDVSGKAKVDFDSGRGLALDGSGLRVRADLNKAALAVPAGKAKTKTEIGAGSSLDIQATSISLMHDGGLSASGRADVDLNISGFRAGRAGLMLEGDKARLSGGANVSIDRGSLTMTEGTLQLEASLKDGKISLPGGVELDLKAGTQLKTALTRAAFGPEGMSLDFAKGSSLKAELDSGKLSLPGGQKLTLKSGTQVSFDFEQLTFDPRGLPVAKGSMSLDANASAKQVNLASLGQIPGVSFGMLQGYEQHLRVGLGRFELARDGQFSIENMSFGLEGRIKKFTGKIGSS